MERGYGERFGTSDATLADAFGGLLSREQIFEQCDIVLLPQPTDADLPSFRRGQVLWGWPHCVQGPAITQTAIDNRLTCIAWEEMQIWRGEAWQVHVFHKNNELAGFCSVLHALQLAGTTGLYGPPRRAAVIGFGSVGRGAVHGLRAMGLRDLTLFTPDREETLRGPMPGLEHRLFERTTAGQALRDLGDQRGAAAAHPHGDGGAGGLGRGPDDLPGDRDPRRVDPEPADPRVPGEDGGLPPPAGVAPVGGEDQRSAHGPPQRPAQSM